MLAPLSMMIPGADQMLPMLPEPLGTLEKMSKMTLPILFIHAVADEIVPLAQATRAHAAAPSNSKTFEKIGGGASHNDLTARASAQYFRAFQRFLDSVTGGGGVTADAVPSLSVKDLKAELKQRGVPHEHCVEKSELRALLLAQLTASEPEPAPQVAPPGPTSAGAAAGEGGADEMGEQEMGEQEVD